MNGDERKAATAAYKERKTTAGIYVVRCAATGERWVGAAPSLATVQTRIWFTLRLGSNPRPDLQRAWHDHGAASLSFEVLERLADEELPYIRSARLKERAAHWRSALDAPAL